MCVSDCTLYKGCNAVNYIRSRLECELLNVTFPNDSLTDIDGSVYTKIDGWKKEKDGCTPNPCKVGHKCIPTMYNNHICLKFDAPCDVKPCKNNGVCRNKVNGYRCMCSGVYAGDNCEWNKHRYFTYSSGVISSPNYPSSYTNNLRYKYFVRVQAGQRIAMTFSRIDTEAKFDYVQVFDGSKLSDRLLLKYAGFSSSSITVQSTSNTMLMLFTSDGSNTASGFTATYSSHS
ncbi:unnamed protein product [Mytilus coruscus]|uniref:CUBN n=1 Tax=Mytilus coruscus TaxID=42192 RepID=A0A6J7ZV01_MYTCO|nr:unnamed protein product [Mytilus coruscus]